MTDITHQRRFIEHTQQYVATNFTHLQQGSGALAIALMILAAIDIAACAGLGRLDPATAFYQAGLTCEAMGFVMVIGWGASRGHGKTCTSAATVADEATGVVERRLDLMEDALNKRLDDIVEEFNRRLGGISSDLHSVVKTDCEAVDAARTATAAALAAAQATRDELALRRSRN